MRFLLLQVRDLDDPMRDHEVNAFVRAIGCRPESISVLDALTESITNERLKACDMLLIGGSGDYSACGSDRWLLRTLDGLRLVYERSHPTFASCWGFQALARALGGKVVRDTSRGEVGTHAVCLTEQGKRDPIMESLPNPFWAQMGHMDHVMSLPEGALHLAWSGRSAHQAYTFADRNIYATQFHPELAASDLLHRLRRYPEYLQEVTGMTFDRFKTELRETPETSSLIRRLIEHVSNGVPIG